MEPQLDIFIPHASLLLTGNIAMLPSPPPSPASGTDECAMRPMIKLPVPSTKNTKSNRPVDANDSSSPQLRMHTEAHISSRSSLISATPPPMVKALRSERTRVSTEAAVLSWLAEPSVGYDLQVQVPGQGPSPCRESIAAAPQSSAPMAAAEASASMPEGDKRRCHVSGSESPCFVLARSQGYRPQVVSRSPKIALPLSAPEFNTVEPSPGTVLCALSPTPTSSERLTLDYQAGVLLRRLSKLQSPTGQFGPALSVLQSLPLSRSGSNVGGSHKVRDSPLASDSWTMAFATILEGVLRDAEDMQVTLSYGLIRHHCRRCEALLDKVTTSRLVVLNAAEEDNMLVVRTPRSGREKSISKESESRRKSPQGEGKEKSLKNTKGRARPKPGGSGGDRSSSSRHSADTEISITGLRDWSNCIFGDPLFALAFSREQTVEFWAGFGDSLEGEEVDVLGRPTCLIEDRSNAQTRMLLYGAYHAITRLVREFYQPTRNSGKRELEARRTLNGIMAKLDAPQDLDTGRRRLQSGDMSPAKRYRMEDDDNDGGSNDTDADDGHVDDGQSDG